jgi:prophage tail gpP-like protein
VSEIAVAPIAVGMMAGAAQEICRVRCNGQIFEGWTEVAITRDAFAVATRFRLSVTEPTTSAGKVLGWQIRPGDPVTIELGGKQVVNGVVDVRQASYDADNHGVQIDGRSLTADIVEAAAVKDDGKPAGPFEGYALDEIARSLLKPYSIGVKVIGDAGAPFARVVTQVGESVFELLERLARLRGLHLGDDQDGDLVLSDGSQKTSGPVGLVEGVNILRASASMDISQVPSELIVVGQSPGDDQTSGADAASQTATATNDKAPRKRPKVVILEEPGSKADMKLRADQELAKLAAEQAQAQVVVQGWFTAGGDLWAPGMTVKLTSPMLLMDQKMVVMTAELAQSDGAGTTTTLTLITPEAFAVGPPAAATQEPTSEDGNDGGDGTNDGDGFDPAAYWNVRPTAVPI